MQRHRKHSADLAVRAGLGCCLALAMVALVRVIVFRRKSLFDSRSEVTA